MTRRQKNRLVRILLTVVLLVAVNLIPSEGLFRFVLYLIPYITIGYDILRKAFLGIFHGQIFDENFLMAVATVGAYSIAAVRTGDYNEAVAVMLFYQIGEFFQSYAVGKSRRSMQMLHKDCTSHTTIHFGRSLTVKAKHPIIELLGQSGIFTPPATQSTHIMG